MNIIEIIDKKRCGLSHTPQELRFLVDGVMAETIPDYQLAAWLMAVCLNGLSLDETTWLTDLYAHSGQILDFSEAGRVVVDKHSTGGVGDKTTLVLAPMLAACDLAVAKLSGRGLGFTGGTVDKLESLPGFKVDLPAQQFLSQVKTLGIALGSQTRELAPADGKIYALRDVTATVASIPLIAASVVSKKIAAGADVITLDIKVGEGAFMKSLADAKALALTCREVGKRLGRSISTVISHMDQPLGNAIGHTVEVIEAIETLKGQGPDDLTDLCIVLGAVALMDAGKATTLEDATHIMRDTLRSGAALQKFQTVIQAQGGNPQVVYDMALMPHPKTKIPILSPATGTVHQCSALKLALAAKALGAGRLTKSAPIDLSVGVLLHKKLGDAVTQGEPLAELWVNDHGIEEARNMVLSAYNIEPTPLTPSPLIEEVVLTERDTVHTS